MDKVSVAIVDSIHVGAIREALDDAGVAFEAVEIRPFNQLAYLRHQFRPQVDIQVAPEAEAEARAVLARVEHEAEEVLTAQAGGEVEAVKSADDLRLEEEARAVGEAGRWVWLGWLVFGAILALLTVFATRMGGSHGAQP
jgi:hypothetical protein